MVAFTKSLLFAAVALLVPSAVFAQTETPSWPGSVVALPLSELPVVKREASAEDSISNGERLARGLPLRTPDRVYRPRQVAARAQQSPFPQTAMSDTYYFKYCADTLTNTGNNQLGNEYSATDSGMATKICAARAYGATGGPIAQFVISMDAANDVYLCQAVYNPPPQAQSCTPGNYAYYSNMQ